jgi:hypothetical protein
MKSMKKQFIVLPILLAMPSAQAQGTIQNLNFEDANPMSVGSPYPPYVVTTASAFPYWSVYYDNVQQTQVSYNAISTGATQVTLVSAGNPEISAIDGNYSALLQAFAPGSLASISQTGVIPSGTQSLLFEARADPAILTLSVESQIVTFSAIGSGSDYVLYGANISAWAGDTEQITFSSLGGTPEYSEIDDIMFSPTALPEPSPLALTGVGGLLFALFRRFAPKRP